MNRRDLVLAVMTAGDGAIHTPVQMQKLLFLIDRKVPTSVGGPHFSFRPFDYGPFDEAVYVELGRLEEKGFVAIDRSDYDTYRLTKRGEEAGQETLAGLPPHISAYIERLSEWVRARTFAALVSAIYREFQDMKVQSVFREA